MPETEKDGAVALEAVLALIEQLATAGLLSPAGIAAIESRAIRMVARDDAERRRYLVDRFEAARSMADFTTTADGAAR